jgi:hypothetical protein
VRAELARRGWEEGEPGARRKGDAQTAAAQGLALAKFINDRLDLDRAEGLRLAA